jgi:hypothetical protein
LAEVAVAQTLSVAVVEAVAVLPLDGLQFILLHKSVLAVLAVLLVVQVAMVQ